MNGIRKLAVILGLVGFLLPSGALLGLQAPEQTQEKPDSPQEPDAQEPKLLSLPSQKAMEERNALTDLMQTEKPEDRLVMVEEFLRKYPDSPLLPNAYLAAAEAYRMLNNYEKAIEYGEKVLERSEGHVLARILVAESLAESTRPSQAEAAEHYQRAEELARQALERFSAAYPEDPPLSGVAPDEYQKQRRYIEAQPHAILGYIHLARGENEQAAEELKQSVDLNSLRPNGTDYLRLAVAQIRLEQWTEARQTLERCAELGGPESVMAREYLDVIKQRTDEPESAGQKPPLQ